MKQQYHPPVYPGEFDPESLEVNEGFDWKSHVALCIEPAPNHPVYGMTFSEFIKYRNDDWDNIGGEKARVGFRVPPEVSRWIPRLSRRYNLHATRYVGLTMELGLITFQKDYHDTYSLINTRMDEMFYATGADKVKLDKLGQAQKQTISLGSSSRDHKYYSPTVPDKVADAITGTASELNCSKSDMVYLCTCIGIQIDSKDRPLPDAFMGSINENIHKFAFELNELDLRVSDIYNKMYCNS